ncbi:hypothetical protein ACN265_21440 [Micromonospora sp. WMMD730]|uniref:hypothetical protein n=1 Tax=Micromonospora sp. WMMD730 TaxID=3404128 RepID=UPI003B93609F
MRSASRLGVALALYCSRSSAIDGSFAPGRGAPNRIERVTPSRSSSPTTEAERTARSEVHDRPAVRPLVAAVARCAAAPPALVHLAAILHVT